MRLRFAADRYRPLPDYRDDNAHLWALPPDLGQAIEAPAEAAAPPAGAGRAEAAGAPGPVEDGAPQDAPAVRIHPLPEWDWRIGLLRPGWCTVREREAVPGDASLIAWRRLPALPASPRRGVRRREEAGDWPHWGAWIESAIERRLGHGHAEARLFLVPRARRPRLDVLLLIDTSASTMEALPARAAAAGGWGAGTTVLQALRDSALSLALALERSGQRSAIAGFASNTRHDLRWVQVKHFEEPALAPQVAARAAGLRAAWSTRLGAAVRHGTQVLRQALPYQPLHQRMLVLLTDGQPHDVDVHDRRTLPADLRHALKAAHAQGVQVLQPPLAALPAAWAQMGAACR